MLPKKVPTPTIFDDLKKSQQTISLVQKQLADLSVIKNKPLKTGKFEAKILETHHLQDAEDQNKKTAEALNELRKTAFQRDSKKMAPVRMLSGNAMMHSRIAKPSIDKNKEQYEKLCAVMRNMIETMGHLQSFVLELEKLSETRLRKMYSDLSKQKPETLEKLSKKELIAKIKTSIDQIQQPLRGEIDRLHSHYVTLRQKVDPEYKKTIEVGNKINSKLQDISRDFEALAKICDKNHSRLGPIIREFNKKLQDVLLNNTLDQSKFNTILKTATLMLDQLRLAMHNEMKSADIDLHLSHIHSILNGDLSEDLKSFRKTLLGSVANSAMEFALPLVMGALNALIPIPLPTHHFTHTLDGGIYSATSVALDKGMSKATEEKMTHLNVLDKEWEKLWYVEAVKKADFASKGMAYMAAVGSSALLTAVGAPHLAVLLVPAGLTASSAVVPAAIQKINTRAAEAKVFTGSMQALTDIQKKIVGAKSEKKGHPVLSIVQDFLQLDEKRMIEFEIEATKIGSQKNYYELNTATSVDTLARLDRIEENISRPNSLEVWSLLKIYHNAQQLEKATDPTDFGHYQTELLKSIDEASLHATKYYADYNSEVYEDFLKVLSDCKASLQQSPSMRMS